MFKEQTDTQVVKSGTWIEKRRKSIGGSEIAAVLGLTPKYKTPYDVWLEKTGRVTNVVDNVNTRRGIILEPAIADYFQQETGIALFLNNGSDPLHFTHPVHSFISATPDGFIKHHQTGQIIGNYEAKSTKASIDPDDLPMPWFCQLIYGAGILLDNNQMAGFADNYLAWIDRSLDFGNKRVEFDREFYQFLLDKAGEFWTNYVQTDTPPPPINVDDVLKIYPRHEAGKVIEATPELGDQLAVLTHLKNDEKAIKARKEAIEERLKLIMGDAEAITFGGSTVVTWKAANDSKVFDTEGFAKEQPDLYEKYLITRNGSRRFLLKS